MGGKSKEREKKFRKKGKSLSLEGTLVWAIELRELPSSPLAEAGWGIRTVWVIAKEKKKTQSGLKICEWVELLANKGPCLLGGPSRARPYILVLRSYRMLPT